MTIRVLPAIGLVMLSLIFKAQTLNYYFGNLHSHSGYSDGNKDSTSNGVSKPSGDYSYAKLSQHFDFLGIAEHNHYSSNNNPGMVRTSYGLGLAQAAAANQDGTFLTLYGMEWGVSSSTYGHVVVYGFNQLIGWETSVPGLSGPNYDIFNAKADYAGLFRLVKNNPNAFCTLAHPSYTDYNSLAGGYSAMYDSAIVGVPLRNGNALDAAANYTTYPAGNYFGYYRILLNRGYHVGMTYDHDNHYLNFGRGNAGRLVIIAPALTQPDLYSAMKKMHFYGSDDWNTKVDFKLGTYMMGDSCSGTGDPVLSVVHNDGDGEQADSIKLWSGVSGSFSDPKIIKVVKNGNTLLHTDYSIISDSARYYLAEIIQPDGNRIVTSPIWYRKSGAMIGIKEYANDFSFVMFPNPAFSKLSLSTGLNSDYTIEIYAVNGEKMLSERVNVPDVTIDTHSLASGFYTLKVSSAKGTVAKKLVIE